MRNLEDLAKDWLPPVCLRMIRQCLTEGITFSGEYATWAEAQTNSTGYDADDILAKVFAASLRVKRGEVAFERDSVTFDKIEYDWPVLAGLMWAAARNNGRLNVLDFGGSLGSSYFQYRRFLGGLKEVRWNVVEQAHYVECGKTHIQDETLRFYPTISDCLTTNEPNAILLSSVLQYLEEPYLVLRQLMGSGIDILIVDRLIVNISDYNRIYLQHVPQAIYRASYPCWSFSDSLLKDFLGQYYELISDFASLDFPGLEKIDSIFKGFVWCNKVPCR
jgi:putative methyltransferase (TIGR04325 family)